MAKKKKRVPQLSRRAQEKLRVVCRQCDKALLGYALLVLLCTAVGMSGPYELGRPALNGFALWFLLLPAYLPLELLNVFCRLLNWSFDFSGYEAVLLGGCDLFLALTVWLATRLLAKSRGAAFVRNVRLFVLIFVYWGIFQLGCFAALWMWQRGGFTSLHRHLARSGQQQQQQ